MSRLAVLSLLGTAAVLGALLACSESGDKAPSCPAGYTADAQGRCCDAQGSCLGATTPCGPNAAPQASGGCGCVAPFADCNSNIGLAGGDGCECNGRCSGGQCTAATCDPSTEGACGSRESFCEATSRSCAACPAGKHDCDGLGQNGCESDDASCGAAGQCSPTAASACPSREQYCDASLLACQPCPAGMHNCDGLGPCESTKDCAPSGCDASCQQENQIYCVRDPARGNLCTPCLEDAHCRANPSSRGPFCDTDKNLCYCKIPDDCAGDRRGSLCKEAGSVMSCGCDEDKDCIVAEYTKCSPTVFGECIKPCKTEQDCDNPDVEVCDTASGLCY